LANGRQAYLVRDGGGQMATWYCRSSGAARSFDLCENASKRHLLSMANDPAGQQPGQAGVPFVLMGPEGEASGRLVRLPSLRGPRVVLESRGNAAAVLVFSGRSATLDEGAATLTRKPIRRGFGKYPTDSYRVDITRLLPAPTPALLLAAVFASAVWSGKADKTPGEGHLWKDISAGISDA
jgi:hypothetical protein